MKTKPFVYRDLEVAGVAYWLRAFTCLLVAEKHWDEEPSASPDGLLHHHHQVWLAFPDGSKQMVELGGRSDSFTPGQQVTYVSGARRDEYLGVQLLVHGNANGEDCWIPSNWGKLLASMRLPFKDPGPELEQIVAAIHAIQQEEEVRFLNVLV